MKRKMNDDSTIPSVEEQLKALDHLSDAEIDYSDIPEILNWEGAERGKFYRPVKKLDIYPGNHRRTRRD